jgi:hypothetical protein
MNETEQKIEALAKIERQILWLRDDVKAFNTKKSYAFVMPFIYSIGVMFVWGIATANKLAFIVKLFSALLWPFTLGVIIGDKLK